MNNPEVSGNISTHPILNLNPYPIWILIRRNFKKLKTMKSRSCNKHSLAKLGVTFQKAQICVIIIF